MLHAGMRLAISRDVVGCGKTYVLSVTRGCEDDLW